MLKLDIQEEKGSGDFWVKGFRLRGGVVGGRAYFRIQIVGRGLKRSGYLAFKCIGLLEGGGEAAAAQGFLSLDTPES